MKLKGRKVINDNLEIVVIPRKDNNLVFKFQPVLDFEEFDNYVKMPEPPWVQPAGKPTYRDFEDNDYRLKLTAYATQKSNWVFLKSISATEDLEWETVEFNKPETWANYREELRKSGFTDGEMTVLFQAMMSANSLDEAKLEKARESFLLTSQPQP